MPKRTLQRTVRIAACLKSFAIALVNPWTLHVLRWLRGQIVLDFFDASFLFALIRRQLRIAVDESAIYRADHLYCDSCLGRDSLGHVCICSQRQRVSCRWEIGVLRLVNPEDWQAWVGREVYHCNWMGNIAESSIRLFALQVLYRAA